MLESNGIVVSAGKPSEITIDPDGDVYLQARRGRGCCDQEWVGDITDLRGDIQIAGPPLLKIRVSSSVLAAA